MKPANVDPGTTPATSPVPVAAEKESPLRKWRRRMEEWRWKWTLSLASSALLALYIYCFFYKEPLRFSLPYDSVYSWVTIVFTLLTLTLFAWSRMWVLTVVFGALLAFYAYLLFFGVVLHFTTVQDVAYSWGGALGALVVCALLKLPRVVTQESGDKVVPVTENVIALLQLTQLMYIAGKVSTPAMAFPPGGQFVFWVMVVAVFTASSVSIYWSIRLAERTWEES